ncbi:MAG: hydroxymethylbilane synthase [Pseudomonadota bacterium]|nr:hydroxymethylbilane synthase [Pseudomonadota bacterium]
MHERPILGTRGSPLALAQSKKVASALEVANRWPAGWIEIRAIRTTGDAIQDRPLAEIGGKMLWTKELDRALLAGETNFSVHSMKDVESVRPDRLRIAAVRPRGDVRERLIGANSIEELKQGAVVGTSSPRRAAQLLSMRPDLKIVPLRGNVDTRLEKVRAGEVDATLLAAAGLNRLGKTKVGKPIPVEIMLPAPTQAVIGIECCSEDSVTQSMLTIIDDRSTHVIINAERAFVRALGGSCHSPVAALAVVEGGKLWLRAELYSADGREKLTDEARFECGDQEAPAALAKAMLARAPDSIRKLFEAA